MTPLHHAAAYNCFEVSDLLINRGADIGAIEESGYTPFSLARLNTSTEVINQMLARGTQFDLGEEDS